MPLRTRYRQAICPATKVAENRGQNIECYWSFGVYEAEYRFALKNAGFDGFRVLLFKDSDGIKAASGEPGLKFTIDFGFGMLNAMHLGDVINDMIYQIRPFEVNKGETDRVFREMVDGLCEDLRTRDSFEGRALPGPRCESSRSAHNACLEQA
ncbi:MAG: hypothetical protein WBQ08_03605 [Candidatus Sulfotelmatobacter sp.]